MEFEKIEHRRTGYCGTFRSDSIGKTPFFYFCFVLIFSKVIRLKHRK